MRSGVAAPKMYSTIRPTGLADSSQYRHSSAKVW